MQNEAGVILHLKAKRTGLMLSLGGMRSSSRCASERDVGGRQGTRRLASPAAATARPVWTGVPTAEQGGVGQALTDGHEGQAVLCVHHQLSLCDLGFPRIRAAAPAGGAGTDASGGGVERKYASGRKRPERSAMMRRIILLLVWSVSLWGCGLAAQDPGPTAQGYVVHASAVPNTLFLPSDLVSQQDYPTTATLSVQVHDAHATPVEGVPVTFQFVGSECQGVVTRSASRRSPSRGARPLR